jgi:hypothetical protein
MYASYTPCGMLKVRWLVELAVDGRFDLLIYLYCCPVVPGERALGTPPWPRSRALRTCT